MGFGAMAAVVLFLAFIFPEINGDQGLIISVCSKTVFPEFCETCFQSTPGSDGQDIKQLAGTMISGAKNQAAIVMQIALDISRNSTGYIKEKLERCVPYISSMTTFIGEAFQSWKDSNYPEAATEMARASEEYEACTSYLGGITPPPGFWVNYAAMNAYNQDGEEILKLLLTT